MKLIFFLFLFAVSLFASDDWWVYTYEDVSTLNAVFNYLAMVGDDAGYMQTIQTILFAGMSFSVVLKFLDITAVPKYFVSVTGIMLVIFGTTTTVHIVNVKSYTSINPQVDNYAVVDNVPYIFAVLTSAFSTVGYNSADLIETIFTSIGNNAEVMENSFLKTGHLGGFKVLEKLNSIDPMIINDTAREFSTLYHGYLSSCVFGIAYVLDDNLKNKIINEPNIFEFIDPSTSINNALQRVGSQQITKSDGTLTTCTAYYNEAKVKYTLIKNSGKLYTIAKSLIGKTTSNVDNSASSAINMVSKSQLADAQPKITTYIMNNGMRNVFENAWMSYGVGTTSSSQAAYGTGLAVAQMQLAGKIKASSAGIIIPTMHSVLQAVMYVLFPFVILVQLFAGGIKILQNYTLGLLWLEFWVPSFSVLNYFTLKEAETQSIDKLINLSENVNSDNGLLTIANQTEIFSTIANQAAVAGDMYWMIPGIAAFILYGSYQSIAGITSGAAGIVGQYSSNQTLESERAKFSAYDQINEEMKKENPLYTGNIGTISAMSAQASFSTAGGAAGKFLASNGGNLNDISKMTKADMFGGLENQVKSETRTDTLSGGGALSNASNVISNNANIGANTEIGSSNAVNKDSNLLSKVMKAGEVTQDDSANKGNSRYDFLASSYGSVGNGSAVQNYVEQGSNVKSVVKQIEQAEGIDSLIDTNAQKAQGETASTEGSIDEAEKRGTTYANFQGKSSTNKTSEELTTLDAKKGIGAISDSGSQTKKGQKVTTADVQSKIESTSESVDAVGGIEKYNGIIAREEATKTSVVFAKQSEGDKYGGYENVMTGSGRLDIGTKSLELNALKDSGLTDKNDGSYNQTGQHVVGENLKHDNLDKTGKANTYTETPDSKEVSSSAALESKNIEDGSNLIKNAKNAYDSGYIKDDKVSSLVSAQGQNFSVVSSDGAEVKTTTDSNNNTVGTKREKVTDEGVSTVYTNANGKEVKTDLDAVKKTDSSTISLNNTIDEQKTSQDYSYNYNASRKWDFSAQTNYTVGNIGAETFTAAEKLANQNEASVYNHLRNEIVTDIIGNAAKGLPFGGIISPLATSIVKDAEIAITDTTNESGYRNVPGNPNFKQGDNLSEHDRKLSGDDKIKLDFLSTNPNSSLPTNSISKNY